MLLEPLDPMLNGYNISCIFDGPTATLEIVGPGFDASDLQRGQTEPHESRSFDPKTGNLGPPRFCSDATYSGAVKDRERKVWWKYLLHEAAPTHWNELSPTELDSCRRQISEARGASIPPKYVPISDARLDEYVSTARPVLAAWRKDYGDSPAVLAGSFVQDGSFRFWDVNTAVRWVGKLA
jgi:hypothetical protein